MALIIIAILYFGGRLLYEAWEDSKPTYPKELDWQKMSYDQSMNGLSNRQVEKNMWNGKYDKK